MSSGQIGNFNPTPSANRKGVFDPDYSLPRNYELRLDGDGLSLLERRFESLGKHRELVRFQTDAMPDETGILSRSRTKFVPSPASSAMAAAFRKSSSQMAPGFRFSTISC